MSSVLPVCFASNSSYINNICELRDIVSGTLPNQTEVLKNATANAPSFAGRVVSASLSTALDVAVRVVEYSPVGTIITGLTISAASFVQARKQWNALPGDRDYSRTKLVVYSGVTMAGLGLAGLGVKSVVNASDLFKVLFGNSTTTPNATLVVINNTTNATNATVEAVVNNTTNASNVVIILPNAPVEELVAETGSHVSQAAEAVKETAAKIEEVKTLVTEAKEALKEVTKEAAVTLEAAKITVAEAIVDEAIVKDVLTEAKVHTELAKEVAKEAEATLDSLKNLVAEPQVQHAATQEIIKEEVKTGALKKLANYAWGFFSNNKEKTA
ncbi:MAG: hypothetical protein LLF94_00885 [Chlamydiales bacterium]|nr:hypothetical protein [Chlamydiales bacterium]